MLFPSANTSTRQLRSPSSKQQKKFSPRTQTKTPAANCSGCFCTRIGQVASKKRRRRTAEGNLTLCPNSNWLIERADALNSDSENIVTLLSPNCNYFLSFICNYFKIFTNHKLQKASKAVNPSDFRVPVVYQPSSAVPLARVMLSPICTSLW